MGGAREGNRGAVFRLVVRERALGSRFGFGSGLGSMMPFDAAQGVGSEAGDRVGEKVFFFLCSVLSSDAIDDLLGGS